MNLSDLGSDQGQFKFKVVRSWRQLLYYWSLVFSVDYQIRVGSLNIGSQMTNPLITSILNLAQADE